MSSQQTPSPAPSSSEASRQAQAISASLRLFASLFEREVHERLLGELVARREELSSVLDSDPLIGLDLRDLNSAAETLAVEYCRLFIGPRGHLPPVESIVRGEGRFWGASTEKVVSFYEAAGVAPPQDSKLLPDHVAMELDCLALLQEQGRRAEAAELLREYLLCWLPDLIRHVERNATLAFYPTRTRGIYNTLQELSGPSENPPGTDCDRE